MFWECYVCVCWGVDGGFVGCLGYFVFRLGFGVDIGLCSVVSVDIIFIISGISNVVSISMNNDFIVNGNSSKLLFNFDVDIVIIVFVIFRNVFGVYVNISSSSILFNVFG